MYFERIVLTIIDIHCQRKAFKHSIHDVNRLEH